MRRFYGIFLILVGLIFLFVLRERLVLGLSVFTGDIENLDPATKATPDQNLIVLSYAIPLAATGIGIITLIRDFLRKKTT